MYIIVICSPDATDAGANSPNTTDADAKAFRWYINCMLLDVKEP